MRRIDHPHGIVTLEGVLTPEMCTEWINRAEHAGLAVAPISGHGGPVMNTTIRDNTRVIFDDMTAADALFRRMQPLLDPDQSGWALEGLNERFRVYRYQVGQRFRWHRDGHYERPRRLGQPLSCSHFSLLLYLNDDFEGGRTEFRPEVRIEPKTGSALLFPHAVLHQGARVEAGCKYLLRTDVMYRFLR